VTFLAVLVAALASLLSGYYVATGLRSGRVESFSKSGFGQIARKSRPGWYWASIAIWVVGALISADYAVRWAIALAAA
jgi:hypothetical protein